MEIDMSNYKMIYKDQVFNVVSIMPEFTGTIPDAGFNKPTFLNTTYVDENGEIRMVRDEAWRFKFVRR